MGYKIKFLDDTVLYIPALAGCDRFGIEKSEHGILFITCRYCKEAGLNKNCILNGERKLFSPARDSGTPAVSRRRQKAQCRSTCSKLVVVFAVAALLIATHISQSRADIRPEQPGQAVALVLDTSPGDSSLLRGAAVNIYRSLPDGILVLLFEVRGKTTNLRFACTKDRDDKGLAGFCRAVRKVSCDWFAGARIGSALNGPVYERLVARPVTDGQAAIVVVGSGGFSSSQAEQVCSFAERVKAVHGWPVLVTASISKVPRRILSYAAKASLYWEQLDAVAKDGSIASRCIRRLIPGGFEAPGAVEKASTKEPTALEKAGLLEKPAIEYEPSQVAAGSFDVADVAVDTNLVSANMESSARQGGNELNLPSPPVEVNAVCTAGTGACEVDTVTSTVRVPNPVSTLAPGDPNGCLYPGTSEPSAKGPGLLVLVAACSAGGIALAVLAGGWLKAALWDKKLRSPLDAAKARRQQKPRVLMARVGRQLYRLGDLQRFGLIHVGSSVKNTIRIGNDKIAARQLKVYQHRDYLFVRNLGKEPITVENQQLPRGKKCRLLPPASLLLPGEVEVRFFVEVKEDETCASKG